MSLLAHIRNAFAPFKSFIEGLSQIECAIVSAWARSAHRRLMLIQWRLPPLPENFDHRIDLFFCWLQSRNPQWLERGVYSALCLKGGKVLELCCGDGFNARNFYSLVSQSVLGCDFDPVILKRARRNSKGTNVSFVQADIRTNMPVGIFDNVVWDAAIEHFSPAEIDAIMKNIKNRLSPGGILSGHTVAASEKGQISFLYHEYEFSNKEDLRIFLMPYFKNVLVFETVYPQRHNLYFWASDGAIPFSPQWIRSCDTWRTETAGAGSSET